MIVSRICCNLAESILPSARGMFPCAATQSKSMIDPSPCTTAEQVFVFTNFDVLCSPNTRLLILACNLYFIGWQDFFSPKFFSRCSLAKFWCWILWEAIFVQVSLNSWAVCHDSRVCQIFLEVFCSQTWVLTSCFSSDAMSSTLSFRPYLDLTFNSFLYSIIHTVYYISISETGTRKNTFLSCCQHYATA